MDEHLTLTDLAALSSPVCACCGLEGAGPEAWELLDSDGQCPRCAEDNARLDAAWDEGWDETSDVSLAVVSL